MLPTGITGFLGSGFKRRIIITCTHFFLYQLRPDVRLDDVRFSHVAHAEHEAQDTVPLADDGVSTEQQRLRALFRPGQLGEHHAHHERLDHDAHYAL